MAYDLDSRGGLRGDDAAVAVGDHDGRLVAVLQHLPHRGNILGQPGTAGTAGQARLAAARQRRAPRSATPRSCQQLGGAVPPPRPVPARTPRARTRPSSRLHVCLDLPRPIDRRTDRYVKKCGDGRHRQPHIRQRLLDACADHALAHGLPDRLGPLATATGTSTRMLIYHFGTRDALLASVLGHARQRQLDSFSDLLRLRPGEPYPATLDRAWTSITGPEGSPTCGMFGQLHDTAGAPALARLPAHRDDRLARAARGRPAQHRPTRSRDRSSSLSSAVSSWTSTPPATAPAPTGPSRLPRRHR